MFCDDVCAGLSQAGQKQLPCQYFYDDVGTALFEAITVLPEYGLTRADTRLIRRLAPQLPDYFPCPATIVELGSGTGSKTRRILESMARRAPVDYYPIDISAAALARCAQEMSAVAAVHPIEATYLDGLQQAVCARRPGHALLVLFLGSTIGNFARDDAQDFLSQVRSCLMPGDALLLGADLIKPLARMLLAYDDPAGVTAAFNRNLLARINRELQADFALRGFAHEARWNPLERRVEMHLRSLTAQRISIRAAGFHCTLSKNETIWTESCHKFETAEMPEIAAAAGFECRTQWLDDTWPFAESLHRVSAVVEFRAASYRIGAREILKNLTLAVEAGETLVLLGRSGSGKTTALKMVNGLVFPSAGEVLVDGTPTTAWDPVRLKRRIGYVIQEIGLFPHYTIAQNVAVVPRLERWEASRIQTRVDALLNQVGLEPGQFGARYPAQLSGGQRQRVGVARALAADPSVLLFDEPFGAVDPVTRLDLQKQFLALRRDLGKTAIFVTHDVREALMLASRIALLRDGALELVATPRQFLDARGEEARAFLACLDWKVDP